MDNGKRYGMLYILSILLKPSENKSAQFSDPKVNLGWSGKKPGKVREKSGNFEDKF